MLNLEPTDLRTTYVSALASAELLRREGETAKAARVESLARIIARELQLRDPRAVTDLDHSAATKPRIATATSRGVSNIGK